MQVSTSFSVLLTRCKPARKQTNCGGLTALARHYSDAKVPFELIKQLRLKTKAGLSDCKEALAASGNDPAKAEEWLRKRASVIAAKKSDRVAAEGLIAAVADKQRKRAVLVELLCETDFASRSPSYVKAVADLAALAYQEKMPAGTSETEAFQKWVESAPVKEKVESLAFSLRENVKVRRVMSVVSDAVGVYFHNKNEIPADVTVPADAAIAVCPKVAVVALRTTPAATGAALTQTADFGDKLARQVFAMNPKFLTAAEKAAAKQPADAEEPWETLGEQEFIAGGDGKTTADFIASVQKKLKADHQIDAQVASFLRWEVGEGVERKAENYGEEVAKLVNGEH